MKRIISLAIVAALQLACTAQDNPKLESLYAYLKAKGLVKYYTLSNKNQEGLRKRYDFNFGLNNEGPAPTMDYMGRLLDAKADSAVRAEWREKREALKVVRRTLSELTENAAESYSYEYHQNGHDTIITTIALKPYENAPIPRKFEYPENDSYGTGKTPEMVYFRYFDSDRGRKKRMSPIGFAELRVNTIVDTTLYATKDFNVDALHKALQPLFKDKTIKHHEIHCVHDSTFDVYTIDETTPFIEGFMRVEQSVRRQGDNRLTVYKFTSEEKAKVKLHQVMECVRQYIADHPREAYTIFSDEYFPPLNPARMFRGESCRNMYEIDEPRKSMTIDALMDEHGFYILINVWDNDEYLPYNWKHLKEMVNGKKTYFKSDDWWE
ncbi:MAG: hypothetical protein IKP43_02495 [Bacteroidaceae bacterium]|nr:hypothetical protein [Bacteroidaceae bacterium]